LSKGIGKRYGTTLLVQPHKKYKHRLFCKQQQQNDVTENIILNDHPGGKSSPVTSAVLCLYKEDRFTLTAVLVGKGEGRVMFIMPIGCGAIFCLKFLVSMPFHNSY